MKELQKIVAEVERARDAGKPAALATVVAIEGSSYRLPGARMLIVDGRWVAGSISGGCLEDDVVLRAHEAVARDRPSVAVYDTTRDDDVIFGVGLGCKGVITILIEPIRGADAGGVDFVAFAKACLDTRSTGYAATVVRAPEAHPAKPGNRLVLRESARLTDIEDASLQAKLEKALPELSDDAALLPVPTQHGDVLVFLERIDPPVPLVVCGAGHDAMPVVRLAKELGWHVTLADHRPAYATAARFPDADRIVVGTPGDAASRIAVDSDTLALVMTHSYLRDLEWVELLLPAPLRYLGLLGPRTRTDRLFADLREKGIEPAAAQLAHLYAPVGLDIGSEGPAEVALSILSEMQAVMTRHAGGHLRARKAPIHQRREPAPPIPA